MNSRRSIGSRVARVWRALWPVLIVVAGAVTCDSPTSLGRRASLAVSPMLDPAFLTSFSGLTVDSVRITVTRPPSTVLTVQTFAFSPDSTRIQAKLTVQLSSGHEQLDVQVEFLAGTQVLFKGTQTVDVVAGTPASPAPVPITYVGPGKTIATVQIAPRDSGVIFGSSAQYTVTARDSSNQAVTQFYVSWRTGSTADTINGAGLFRAGSTRGMAWVYARTPTGIRDSTRVLVAPVPTRMQVVGGSGQTGTVGTALSQQLVVEVLAADNLPVAGVRVQSGPRPGAARSHRRPA